MELANNSDEHVRSVVARGRQADKEWLWWIEIIFFEEAALSQAEYTVQYLTKTHPYNSLIRLKPALMMDKNLTVPMYEETVEFIFQF